MKKIKIAIILVIFIIGLTMLLFPICSNILSKVQQEKIIMDYMETIENMSDEEKEKTLEKYKNYNNSLTITSITEGESINSSHIDFFQIGNILGYIEIPKINIYLPIFEGTADEVLAKGIGHLENTSLPIGGINTHAVLAGHTGYTHSRFFDDIDKLEIGDKFYIYIYDEKLEYEINQIKIVSPNDTSDIQIEENKDYITLVTCTPQIINTLRLLVRGERIYTVDTKEIVSEEPNIINTEFKQKKDIIISSYPGIIIITYVVLVLAILCFFNIKKRSKKIDKK